MENGLLANTDQSHWENSNEYENPKGFVYLGYTPFHFAANACYDGSRGLVLEIEVEDMNVLYPDAHHMAFRFGWPGVDFTKEMAKALVLSSRHLMVESMQKTFGVCHLGDVKPTSIKRHIIVDWKARKSMADMYLQEATMIRSPSAMKLVEYVLNESMWATMPKCFKKTGIEVFPAAEREVSKTTMQMLKEAAHNLIKI